MSRASGSGAISLQVPGLRAATGFLIQAEHTGESVQAHLQAFTHGLALNSLPFHFYSFPCLLCVWKGSKSVAVI